MAGNLSGPGIGLMVPQNLYPSELTNAPYDSSSNQLGLSPGESLVLPAGDWIVGLGMYTVLQFLDPVTNSWYTASGAAWTRGMQLVSADGFNVRIANLTGCVVSASVINGGTNYVQATTTITAIGAFTGAVPTLLPIVGGALGVTGGAAGGGTLTSTNAGGGYGVAPIVMIPPPPPAQVNANGVGGIQASAIAIIASGTVSSISVVNQGAGYPTAPTAVIVPSPFDPNLSSGITNATVTFSLVSTGVIMGALVTNNGSPLVNGSLTSVTLSVGGAGASGSLTANVMQTVVSATVTGAGTGYAATNTPVMTFGGTPVAGIANTPFAGGLAFLPRPAQLAITGSVTAAGPGTIYDGGLFESLPNALPVVTGGGASITVGTVGLLMGGRADIAIIQPGP